MTATPEGFTKPRNDTGEYTLPELDGGEDMLDRLMSIGYCRHSFSGLVSVSYAEIQSWSEMTGETLTPWEAETLYIMSSIYANEQTRARDPSYVSPYIDEDVKARNKRLDDLFR